MIAWSATDREITENNSTLTLMGVQGVDYSTAFTIDSITFFASPNTIIVFGW